MDLVHHNAADALEGHGCRQPHTLGRRPALHKQIPQNLRRHHDDLRIRTHLDITRQDTHARRGKQLLQIIILLI